MRCLLFNDDSHAPFGDKAKVTDIETLNQTIISCQKCPRLVTYREGVAKTKRRAYQDWEYWGKPVPALGDFKGRLLAVGLAPGPHGSNRTGRMFTGDASGVFLFQALYKAGFASQPLSINRDDGLELSDLLISAVCRCVPPDNKPTRSEIMNCIPYLELEIDYMHQLKGIVALGRIAFDALLAIYRARGAETGQFKFIHGELYPLGDRFPWLFASYHPSQQNTQTGRLTIRMFDQVWQKAASLLDG
jgi:uracil-DNA glycosylase family 4